MNKKIRYILAALIISSHAAGIYSQQSDSAIYSTEEINVISNKVNSNIYLSPVRIDVLNSEYIEKINGNYLSDVLQTAGGVFVKNYGSGSLSTVSVNGLGAEHTLVLLNGFKLNSAQNNLFDLNMLSKDNIDRIEIMNNGSSSIYGSEAIGGVVNIITKQNTSQNISLKIEGLAGSYGHTRFAGIAGICRSGINARFNFSNDVSENNYDYYYDNGTERIYKQRENAAYNYSDYGLNVNFQAGEKLYFDLYSSYTDRYANLPGIEAGSSPSNSNQHDRNWNSIVSINRKFSSASAIKTEFNFQNNLSHYSDRFLDSYYKNIVLSNSTQYELSNRIYSLTSGFDLNYLALESNETEGGIKRIQPGIYAAGKISLNKHLNIFPGLRYDYFSDIKRDVISGKIGVNIKPFADYDFNLKITSGNNFASPTFNELYWDGIGNRNLRPESSFNADAGAIAGFRFITDNIVEVSYTYINARDKIIWVPKGGGIWMPENISESETNSAAVTLKSAKTFDSQLKAALNLNYAYTHSVKTNKTADNDPTFRKQIFYIPEHLFKLGLMVQYKGFGANVFYSYTGRRFTDMENRNFLPAFNLAGGSISQSFMLEKFQVKFEIEANNILNENYQVISGYPMPLRNYDFKIGVEY